MSFPKIAGILWLKKIAQERLQAGRLLLFHCRLFFKLLSLLLQCFGNICSKYEVSCL